MIAYRWQHSTPRLSRLRLRINWWPLDGPDAAASMLWLRRILIIVSNTKHTQNLSVWR